MRCTIRKRKGNRAEFPVHKAGENGCEAKVNTGYNALIPDDEAKIYVPLGGMQIQYKLLSPI